MHLETPVLSAAVCTKLKNSAKQNSWIVCRGFRMARGWHSKPRKSLCDRIHLTFATVSRCLHSLRSVDMTALAAFAISFCQKNSVFLCKGTKPKNSAKPNSWDSLPVDILECFSAYGTGGLISEFSVS